MACWGDNNRGQLGNGEVFTYQSQPADVLIDALPTPLLDVTDAAGGAYHTCAVTNANVYCWGYNEYGQLGNGTRTSSLYATPVSVIAGGDPIVSVAAGRYHTCGLRMSGKVSCWGSNNYYQMGNGSNTDSLTPSDVLKAAGVPLSNATALAAGRFHTCAIVDGGVRCWGYNHSGQIGDGTHENALLAVEVLPVGSMVTGISAGDTSTCATSATTTWCWGDGTNGQIGNGLLHYSSSPVMVAEPYLFSDGFDGGG